MSLRQAATPPVPTELAELLADARALLDLREVAQADELLRVGLLEAESAPPGLRLSYEELACEAAFQFGDHVRALSHAGEAAALAKEQGERQREAMALLALSGVYEVVGNFREALRHHQAYARLREGVLEDTARAALETKAQLEENERARIQLEVALRDVELAEAHLRMTEQTKALEALGRKDPLTGLANRKTFAERMEADFERARRYRSPLTVGLAELDGLAAINQAFGTSAGDEVLRRVADLFASTLRNVDLPARYGTDSFALLLPETGPEGARLVCEKLRAAVEAWHWELVAPGLKVTVSIGLASGTELSNWELLVAAADAALFEACQAGRNRVSGPG